MDDDGHAVPVGRPEDAPHLRDVVRVVVVDGGVAEVQLQAVAHVAQGGLLRTAARAMPASSRCSISAAASIGASEISAAVAGLNRCWW